MAMSSSQNCRALALLLAVLAATSQVSIAAVYKVGDSSNWTTIGNYDYKQWAATKTFHVGDVILFVYHPQFHNVMQVTHTAFQTCNASAPIATHTTGNDSITITTRGHHFFLCGVPGHCLSGQKVDINVLITAPAPTPSGVLPTPSVPAAITPAPPPTPNSAAPLFGLMALLGKLGVSVAVFAALA